MGGEMMTEPSDGEGRETDSGRMSELERRRSESQEGKALDDKDVTDDQRTAIRQFLEVLVPDLLDNGHLLEVIEFFRKMRVKVIRSYANNGASLTEEDLIAAKKADRESFAGILTALQEAYKDGDDEALGRIEKAARIMRIL